MEVSCRFDFFLHIRSEQDVWNVDTMQSVSKQFYCTNSYQTSRFNALYLGRFDCLPSNRLQWLIVLMVFLKYIKEMLEQFFHLTLYNLCSYTRTPIFNEISSTPGYRRNRMWSWHGRHVIRRRVVWPLEFCKALFCEEQHAEELCFPLL
jgi:hypothetical protein